MQIASKIPRACASVSMQNALISLPPVNRPRGMEVLLYLGSVHHRRCGVRSLSQIHLYRVPYARKYRASLVNTEILNIVGKDGDRDRNYASDGLVIGDKHHVSRKDDD